MKYSNQLIAVLFVAFLSISDEQSVQAQPSMEPYEQWEAEWIGVIGGSKPNTWICYRKQFDLSEKPKEAFARISCDSKYWLWINGKLAIFEGQLKRGPTPKDTYFDQEDIRPFLHSGQNTIAVLVWHFGQHGFSHNSSGKAALLFDATIDNQRLVSDESWKVRIHPAYGTTNPPKDNVRQPEANIRFDARHDIGEWQKSNFDDSAWGPPTCFGKPSTPPWNRLFPRPIPQWKNSGLIDYKSVEEVALKDETKKVICRLPYNCHVTHYLKIRSPASRVIKIQSDIQDLYGRLPLIEIHRHEYVTCEGEQEFELLSWLNGHEIHYIMPKDVEVLELKYRETGYDTEVVGVFHCNDDALNQLWTESLRTLYVTMRDTYMDCPDRERAQWWGDAVSEIGEAFYAFETVKAPMLAKKAIYELVRWQRDDATLYSPVPSGLRRPELLAPLDGSWEQELPQQMLASVGWYGFWNYYWYSGDKETIAYAYPAVKKYLELWEIGEDGLVVHRPGGWDWTDWGTNIDTAVVENAWFFLALKGAVEMATLTGHSEDVPYYQQRMNLIAENFDTRFWQENEYRSDGYKGETDDRANAMAVVAGLANRVNYPKIATVLEKENHASPYMEKYVLEALMMMGRSDLAQQRMKIRYARMLSDPYTTLWETFEELNLDGFGSLGYGTYNHAWSGGPLTILSQYIAGIAPTSPAFETYQVLPQLGELTHLHAVVPTKFGLIDMEVNTNSNFPYQVTLISPQGTIAEAGIPRNYLQQSCNITVNGKAIWEDGTAIENQFGIVLAGGDRQFLKFQVPAGKWEFLVVPKNSPESAVALTDEEKEDGFELLFNGHDLANWHHSGNWVVEAGAMHRADSGGSLSYAPRPIPDNFELRFEWKVAPGSNSGLYYRPTQYEYQILDNKLNKDGKNPRTSAAALYFCMAPSYDATKPAGEWNTGKIICQGTVIQHWVNGQKVVGFDYADSEWEENVELLSNLNGDLTKRNGHLHLQDHGDPVWFRGFKLRERDLNEQLDEAPVIPAAIPEEALKKEQETVEWFRSVTSQTN